MRNTQDIGKELASLLSATELRELAVGMLNQEPIAIVSTACRFPRGVVDLETYERFTLAGGDAVDEVPKARWAVEPWFDPKPGAPNRTYSRWGALLEDVRGFEPGFFGIAPSDASRMDPQQRLVLELCWEALERAGLSKAAVSASRTGVYVGAFSHDWFDLQHAGRPYCDPSATLGTQFGLLAAQVSYWLNLRGPALVVETACSSSLVAIHLACESLRRGECDAALAAGVQLHLTPRQQIVCSQLRMLSPRGRCHVFDDDADGIVLGEGAGVVLLRRLGDAQRDADPIVAVLRGNAVNHDGRTLGLNAPNPQAQKNVLEAAAKVAGIDPSDIGYFEAHGTGTAIGDPAELESIRAVVGNGRKRCFVGSSKANFGHTVAASGMAALFRGLSVLRSGVVPGQLHLRHVNQRFDLTSTRFEIARRPTPHQVDIVAVSNFGNSGTNAHVIIEKAPRTKAASRSWTGPWIYMVSEPDEASLRESLLRHAAHLDAQKPEMGDAAWTACARRGRAMLTSAVVADSPEDAAQRLRQEACHEARSLPVANPSIVWLFPGHGAQRKGMGRALLEFEASRDVLQEVGAVYRRSLGFDLDAVLRAGAASHALDEQLVVFAFQAGFASLLHSWGCTPDAVIGHSMGEVAAACAAGVIRVSDGARVMVERRRALLDVSPAGGLAVVGLSKSAAAELIARSQGRLELAGHNDADTVILAGTSEDLDATVVALEARGEFAKRVQIPFAAHSRWVERAAVQLREALAGLKPNGPSSVRFVSSVGGDAARDLGSASYWAENLRRPVEFERATQELLRGLGHTALVVEIAPRAVMSRSLLEIAATTGTSVTSLAVDHAEASEKRGLMDVAARLAIHGVELAWKQLGCDNARTLELPTHPWHRQEFWAVPNDTARGPTSTFSAREGALLREHRVGGEACVPGAVLVDQLCRGKARRALKEIRFEKLCRVAPETGHGPLLEIRAHGHSLEVWEGATRLLSALHDDAVPSSAMDAEPLSEIRARCTSRVDVLHFYRTYRERHGLDYGLPLQGVRALSRGDKEIVAEIELAAEAAAAFEDATFHPLALDACLQAAGFLLPDFEAGSGLLPIGIESIRLHERLPTRLVAHATLTTARTFDVSFRGLDGRLLGELRGFTVGGAERPARQLEPHWQVIDSQPAANLDEAWSCLGDEAAEVARLLAGAGFRIEPGARRVVIARLLKPEQPVASLMSRLFADVRRALSEGAGAVTILTRGAAMAPVTQPLHGICWGLANALALECPEVEWACVDVEVEADVARWALSSVNPSEDRIAIRGGRAFGLRWRAVPVSESQLRWESLDTVVVSGGAGGVGSRLSEALLDAGVSRVVTLGRTRPAQPGGRSHHLLVDVGDPTAVAAALQSLRLEGRRIHGLIHCAGAVVNAPQSLHDDVALELLARAKVSGALNLVEATRGDALQFFMLASSLSSVLGSEDQSGYAAANGALDALAEHLRERGVPAKAIAFGPWAETGMLAGKPEIEKRLAGLGVRPMKAHAAAQATLGLMMRPGARAIYASLDLEHWFRAHESERTRACWSDLRTDSGATASGSARVELTACGAAERRRRVEELVVATLRGLLRLSSGDLQRGRSLLDLGLTSLTALDLRDELQALIGVRIASTTLWNQPSIEALVGVILDKLPAAEQRRGEPAETAMQLAAEDVEAALAKELAEIEWQDRRPT